MKNKIKVIHIISNLSLGGAQILLFDILKNLKKKNDLELTLITIDSGEYIKKFADQGIQVIDIKEKGLINPMIFLKLKRLLSTINPDVVHTHLLKADFYGRIAAKQTGVKIIFSTCHTTSTTHRYNDSITKFFFNSIDNLVIEYSNCHIIAVSNLVKNYLINRKKDFQKRIEVIYNGVDLDKINLKLDNNQKICLKQKLGIKKGSFVISLIGRLEESKGFFYFLKSIKHFLLNENVKVLIAGEGSHRKIIGDFIGKGKLKEKINLLGKRMDIEELMEISNLIAVPSLWEGFGLVIIEAMEKKIITLASNTGGIPEIIEDGKTGFLFKSLDDKSLLDKLTYIYNNINYFEDIKDNALFLLKEKFDITKNTELYYESYLNKLIK